MFDFKILGQPLWTRKAVGLPKVDEIAVAKARAAEILRSLGVDDDRIILVGRTPASHSDPDLFIAAAQGLACNEQPRVAGRRAAAGGKTPHEAIHNLCDQLLRRLEIFQPEAAFLRGRGASLQGSSLA